MKGQPLPGNKDDTIIGKKGNDKLCGRASTTSISKSTPDDRQRSVREAVTGNRTASFHLGAAAIPGRLDVSFPVAAGAQAKSVKSSKWTTDLSSFWVSIP